MGVYSLCRKVPMAVILAYVEQKFKGRLRVSLSTRCASIGCLSRAMLFVINDDLSHSDDIALEPDARVAYKCVIYPVVSSNNKPPFAVLSVQITYDRCHARRFVMLELVLRQTTSPTGANIQRMTRRVTKTNMKGALCCKLLQICYMCSASI